MKPLVSVIVPYYSHGRHLHQAVHAALRAYSGPLEIIVVNDGSREPKAATYLQRVKDLSPNVHLVQKTNGGLSSARNAGLKVAKGEFIQLLDSDDMVVPGKIDLQIASFAIQASADINITNYILCEDSGSIFTRDGDPISRFDFTLKDFLYYWERGFSIPIHSALFRRHVFDGIEFETSVVGKEDWIFWCRQAHAGRRFGYIPVYGAIYRQHDSMSKSFKIMGESWLSAVRTIDKAIGGKEPTFLRASRDWYRSFYAPRIAQQALETSAAKPKQELAQQPVLREGELTWIGDVAASRVTPRKSPLISAVVPVHNHYAYLRACLTSLARQNVQGGVEIVIADDCSSDKRVRGLLKEFADRVAGVKLILNETNVGISQNQNRAAEAASGTYLAFVDCDDFLADDALERVFPKLLGDVAYLFTDREDIDDTNKRLRIAKYGGYPTIHPSGDIASDLLDGMVASHLKIIRRDVYLELGGSDPFFAGIQDWDLALRIAERGEKFVYVPEAVYKHRIHAGSTTQSDSVRQFWLSNIARRRAANKRLGRVLSDDDALRAAKQICRDLAFGAALRDDRALVVRDLTATSLQRDLKQAWLDGKVVVYAPSGAERVQDMNIAREFNSYFDAILAPDEATACFFIGYMWNHEALIFRGEALQRQPEIQVAAE
ncbi:Glycosyl transferase, family 2 [uncultured Defluviicoccus sp.]|uniref:Glycosyl transferase, family 2 n=1 Tax=metagenome TaxID=256318 RepID=A0A380TE59_9ZZZZ|nr:Glycosyl transferase, family 2 [uncultured Defluviicoccus sp.]